MSFLKCVVCESGPVKIFTINPFNGLAKSKCMNCGLVSSNEVPKKDKIKGPEVIYR